MKLIPLTQGKFAMVDDEDYDMLIIHKWNYNKCATRRKGILMHRVIMKCPEGLVVDHINRNRLDNRKANLRICTQAENLRNMRRDDNRTGYVGVTENREWNKSARPYRAAVSFEGKKYNLGRFETPEEAAWIRDQFVRRHFGEFAELNFPEVAPIVIEE